MRPTTLDCSEVRDRLPLYVGEDLEAELGRAVRAHLERCTPCRDEETRARLARQRFREVLDGSLAAASRPGLWAGVRARLAEEGLFSGAPTASAAPSAATPRPARARLLRVLAPLAAAAAVAAVAWIGGRGASSPAEPASAVPGRPAGLVAGSAALPLTQVAERAGGLQRVGAGELSLYQGAEPLRPQLTPLAGERRPLVMPDTTLVNYR